MYWSALMLVAYIFVVFISCWWYYSIIIFFVLIGSVVGDPVTRVSGWHGSCLALNGLSCLYDPDSSRFSAAARVCFNVWCSTHRLRTCYQVCIWVWLLRGPREASHQGTRWAHGWARLASDLIQEKLEESQGAASVFTAGTKDRNPDSSLMGGQKCPQTIERGVGVRSQGSFRIWSHWIQIFREWRSVSSILSWGGQYCTQNMAERGL